MFPIILQALFILYCVGVE